MRHLIRFWLLCTCVQTAWLLVTRSFFQGPFATWTLRDDYYYPQGLPNFTSLKFTNDGQNIILTTMGPTNYLLDAFKGNIKQRLSGHQRLNIDTFGEEVSISPDGRFVFTGL